MKAARSKIAKIPATLFIILLVAMPAVSREFDTGDEAPDFALRDTSGAEFALANTRGKIAIVVFWRMKQQRSSDALTELQLIYAKFKDQGVEVIAISNSVISPEVIGEVKQSKRLTYSMLYDPDEKTYGAYGVIVSPSIFVIDRAGKLSYYYPGYRADFSRQITGRVEVLLGRKTLEELKAELEPVKRAEIPESEKKARRYMKMGERLLEKGMARNAMIQYEKAIREKPDLFEAHLRLGDIYLERKEIEKAEAEFRQSIELKSRSSEAHAGMGDVFFFQEQLEKSVEMLQIALKLNPNLARAHYRLGRVYEKRRRIEDALKEYKAALKILLKIKE